MIEPATFLEIAAVTAGAAGVAGWLLGRNAKNQYREYTPPAPPAPEAPARWEFLREVNGKFVATGELIPIGEDPTSAVSARHAREGVAYAARKVNMRAVPEGEK